MRRGMARRALIEWNAAGKRMICSGPASAGVVRMRYATRSKRLLGGGWAEMLHRALRRGLVVPRGARITGRRRRITMWTCGNCREVLEDQFDACYRCGASRHGKLNLENLTSHDAVFANRSVKEQLSELFVCRRCGERDAEVQFVDTSSLILRFFPLRKRYYAASCTGCASTEFFDAKLLHGIDDAASILRKVFGHEGPASDETS